MVSQLSTRVINTTFACLAVVMLLTFLLAYSETGTPPTLGLEQSNDTLPDYYLTNIRSTQFDKQGMLDFTMASPSVEHNPKDNSANLKEPVFNLYQEGALVWTISSQSGVVYNGEVKVDLQQRVIISSIDQEIILKTPQLVVFPNKKLAKTNKPVTLLNPNGFTRAVGLRADLQTKTIDLLEQVRGQYEGVLYDDEH
ncbi:MAG: LPS export ABC transporter periplasmic protein LptC [Pseudomonadales bacterium]